MHVGEWNGYAFPMDLFAYIDSAADSPHLRPYLAGVGAMAALTAGAFVVFLSVATFVAFHGLPSGGSSADTGAAYLGLPANGAPRAAGAALGGAHAAVTSDTALRSPRGGAGSPGAGPGGSSGQLDRAPSAPSVLPSDPVGPPPSPSSTAGPLESAVSYVNQATGPLGVTAPTGPAGTVDGTARGTLNGAQPGLGDQVSRTGSGLVGGLPQP